MKQAPSVLDAVLNMVRGKKPKELDEDIILAVFSCGEEMITVYCMLLTYGRDLENTNKHNKGAEFIEPIMQALCDRYIAIWWDKKDLLDAMQGRIELEIQGEDIVYYRHA